MTENRPVDDSLRSTLRAAVAALAGPDRTLESADVEVALLARRGRRRRFERLAVENVSELLS
jgi:hypothetical protein